jgi:putative phosphoesterase
MRVLVISDIHGNLPAFEKVLQKEAAFDYLVSIGDVVNYGPWSNECVLLLESIKHKIAIMGNHDKAYVDGFYPGENKVVQAFFNQCYPEFNQKLILESYQNEMTWNAYKLVHTIQDKYVFSDTDISIHENTIIGHSHSAYEKKIGNYHLVNPGSVGQNRKDLNAINYAIWETDDQKFELKQLNYDAMVMINEMKSKNYPDICLNYLLSKLHA